MKTEERMKWFNEAKFGMLIHWGLYSLLERGEQVMRAERIPKKEYTKLAQKFKPARFNLDQWVSLAKEAGMKYMVLTSRHHDGFCLFDSRVSDFTSVKTTAKRDFVAEYTKACRKAGMRVGLYYSLLDWRFPGYHNREKYPESFEAMVKQAHSQVKELMSNYGKIDILWYDGGWMPGVLDPKGIAKHWRSEELNKMARNLQPGIIINNRSGQEEDLDTPEQHVTASKKGRCWESCMTIGDSCGWGYIKHNPNLKPTIQLIQYLVTSASGGGNYLLNVGPKPDGTIHEREVTRLREIGKWMKVNGESIYGSERIPSEFGVWGAELLGTATSKGNIAYFHIFRWPGETAIFIGIKNKVISAEFLATGKKVKFKKENNGKLILKNLPKNPPDKYDTVIKVKLHGKPERYGYEDIPL